MRIHRYSHVGGTEWHYFNISDVVWCGFGTKIRDNAKNVETKNGVGLLRGSKWGEMVPLRGFAFLGDQTRVFRMMFDVFSPMLWLPSIQNHPKL